MILLLLIFGFLSKIRIITYLFSFLLTESFCKNQGFAYLRYLVFPDGSFFPQ